MQYSWFTFATSIRNTCNIPLKHSQQLKHTFATQEVRRRSVDCDRQVGSRRRASTTSTGHARGWPLAWLETTIGRGGDGDASWQCGVGKEARKALHKLREETAWLAWVEKGSNGGGAGLYCCQRTREIPIDGEGGAERRDRETGEAEWRDGETG
jgi:hypothetical protein